ncbi:MAG: peptide/nickel transport system substrate-binding protein [Chloroflexota bacterium]|jgi:peptide/nickel transport system substrate-binding protein|nr:peptide/nickel transport system substrate-binding protein [Chloroflexota bacterium]
MTARLGRRPGPGRRRIRGPLLALALVVVAAVVAGGGLGAYFLTTRLAPAPGGTVTEGLVLDGPLSLLPPFASTQNSRDVSALLDRGLTRIAADGRPEAELAESWEVDATARTYTFHLRPNLQWSDGVPLTSADAAFTLAVLHDQALSQTPVGQAWSGVGVTTPDARTIIYALPSPSAAFLSLTTIGLVPEHYLKPQQVAAMPEILDAPTSGPFRFDSADRNRVVLKRNPHALEPPQVDQLELRRYETSGEALQALLSGDIDMLAQLSAEDATTVSRLPNRRLVRAQSFSYVQLLFNQKQPGMGEVGVRRAVAQGINRQRMVDDVLRGYGHVTGSPIPSAISWVDSADAGPGYDRQAAAAALDAAGWARTGASRAKAGQELSLVLLTSDVDPYPAIARQVKADLADIGLKAEVKQVGEGQVVDALTKREFDLAITPFDNGPDPDVFALWHSAEGTATGTNFSGMAKDPFLDKALEDGRFNADIGARRTAYAEVQKILRESAAAVFLYSPDQLVGTSNRLNGVRLNPGIESWERYEFVQEWYVNTRRVGR